MKTIVVSLLALLSAAPAALAQDAVRPELPTSTNKVRNLATAPGVVVRTNRPSQLDVSVDKFTPTLSDYSQFDRMGLFETPDSTGMLLTPSLAAGGQANLKFTPSGQAANPRAFSLGMTTRVREGGKIVSTGTAQAPASQNLALRVGYYGFAMEAGFNRLSQGSKALAEGLDFGFSYGGKDWRTTLKVSESARNPLGGFGLPGFFAPETARAVQLGAVYEFNNWLAINGGLRYEEQESYQRRLGAALSPQTQNSGAVYLGTRLKF